MRLRLIAVSGLFAVLTACSSPASGTPQHSRTGPPRTYSPAQPSATSTLHGSPAEWQDYADAAVITTADLTNGFKSAPAIEGRNQTQCPSLHAVADSRTSDVAYKRVSFSLKGTYQTVDEVITISPNARSTYDDFASTSRKCAKFQSTAANGDIIKYTVVSDQAPTLGDQASAVWVTGTTHEATAGRITVGSGVIVVRKGPVLMQISTLGIPPPSRQFAGLVAEIAARKLAKQHMP